MGAGVLELSCVRERAKRILAWVDRHKRLLGFIWTAFVIAFIARELFEIGLAPLAQGFPDDLWFFILFAIGFMAVPVSERFIFRRIWPTFPAANWYSLLRKRSLNSIVIGYSGDVWFANWAREKLGVDRAEAFHGVKDASILSGVAAAFFTLGVVAMVLVFGQHDLLDKVVGNNWAPVALMATATGIAIPLLIRFRRVIFRVGPGLGATVFGVHIVRLLAVNAVQVLQYAVVLPFVPFDTWLLFIAAQLLVQQLPLIPNRELLFLAVGVQLTHQVGVDQGALAALLVATTLLRQVGNVVVLIGTTLLSARLAPKIPAKPDADWIAEFTEEMPGVRTQPAE